MTKRRGNIKTQRGGSSFDWQNAEIKGAKARLLFPLITFINLRLLQTVLGSLLPLTRQKKKKTLQDCRKQRLEAGRNQVEVLLIELLALIMAAFMVAASLIQQHKENECVFVWKATVRARI